MKHVRNVAIIFLLAAAVAFVPGGDTSARVISTLLSVIFLAGLVWFAARLYMERRSELYALGDRWRGLLYAAAAVIALTLTATSRLFSTDVGIILWFALMGASIYALFAVWRFSRQY